MTTPAGTVIGGAFGPGSERRSVLDRAHRGDLVGALGRLRSEDTNVRRSWRPRLAAFLAVAGPGVVVMVADNDAGGISTYAQAGRNYGLGMVGLLVVLGLVLFVNQEMVARLGAVTGAGHARLITERFGRAWGVLTLVDLLVLNVLVVVTEFLGVAMGLGYFGISRYVAVPVAGAVLVGAVSGGSFRRWERSVYVMVAASLVALPLLVVVGSHHASLPTSAAPALGTNALPVLVLALVGTSVAPWQLFFHQSSVVDKRITPRWLAYERLDTGVGAAFFALGALGVLGACALGLHAATGGGFPDAGTVAADLGRAVGPWAGALFAVALVNGSVLGAGAVALSTSYALGDTVGYRHSLHRSWGEARAFHLSYAGSVGIGAAIVLIPGAPLGILTLGVQMVAGVLLPGALVFLVLLCNDTAVLGPWVNSRAQNALSGSVVAALLVLSGLLVFTALDPHLSLSAWALGGIVAGVAAIGAAIGIRLRPGSPETSETRWSRPFWTMPPLESLESPPKSRARTIGVLILRVYLVLSAVAVGVKVTRLVTG